MNRFYRLVFNRTLGLFQVASETTRLRGKTGSSRGTASVGNAAPIPRLRTLTAAIALGLGSLAAPAMAQIVIDTPIAGSNGNPGDYASGAAGGAGGAPLPGGYQGGDGGNVSQNGQNGGGAAGGAGGTIAGGGDSHHGRGGGGGNLASGGFGSGGGGGAGVNNGAGGGGAGGGLGLAVADGDTLINNSGIYGGGGGSGRSAVGGNGYGGSGGGGAALLAGAGAHITNNGTIAGGGGSTGSVVGAGFGGVGVILTGGGTLVNNGNLYGGSHGDGSGLGPAAQLAGGGNTLELHANSVIIGDVVSDGGDTLALGGGANHSFDVTQIGAAAQYQGFTHFLKTGTSTWTLANTTTELTPWTIEQGVLDIDDDASLGDTAGALTLGGGTLFTSQAITSARNIVVGSGGGTLDNGGFANGFSGDLSGSGGRLAFAGAGTTTYTGDGSQFTGPTTVATGSTLALAGAGSLPASALTINGAFDITGITASGTAIKSFGGSGSLALGNKNLAVTDANGGFSGAISGTGELSFAGAGGTTLSGVSTFSGTIIVASGLLAFGQNTVLPGALTVRDGATLGASTATIASLDNAGTAIIAAATHLTVNGGFSTSGTLQLNVASMAEYGKVEAGGDVALSGELRISANPNGAFSAGSLADVITGSSVNGAFDSYSDNSLLFDFTPEYTATAMNLKVAAVGDGDNGGNNGGGDNGGGDSGLSLVEAIVAQHGNSPAFGAAHALGQTFASDPTGALATRFMPFSTDQQVNEAVSQTLPLLTGSGTLAMQNTLSDINNIIQARLEGQRGLSSGDAFANSQVWVKAFGSRADQNHNGAEAGFEADTYGLSVGVDGEIVSGHRVGLAFAAAKADIDSDSRIAPQSAEVDIYQLVGYGSYALSANGELNYQLGFGQNQTDGKRHLPSFGLVAIADYDSTTTYAGVGYSHTLQLSGQTTLVPSVRMDYSKIEDESYRETGADALNLHVSGNTSEALVIGADGKLEHRLNDKATLQFNVGFGYDLVADRDALTAVYAGAPAASFVTYGQDVDPWIANGGIGFAYQATDSLAITARYDAQKRARFDNQTASLKALWKF